MHKVLVLALALLLGGSAAFAGPNDDCYHPVDKTKAVIKLRWDCYHVIGAIQRCTELIKRSAKDAAAYAARGSQQQDPVRAMADYNKALKIDPKCHYAYNGRARLRHKAGKHSQALADAQRAVQLRPENPANWDTRGHILEALGKRDAAIADFRRALTLNPDVPSPKQALKRLGVSP